MTGFGDLFRHHTWANLQLIDVCTNLTPEQRAASVDETYGSIGDTLVHAEQTGQPREREA